MRYVTVTELRKNLSYYLTISRREPIYVTKNGVVVSMLSNPEEMAWEKFSMLKASLKRHDTDQRPWKDIVGDVVMEKSGF